MATRRSGRTSGSRASRRKTGVAHHVSKVQKGAGKSHTVWAVGLGVVGVAAVAGILLLTRKANASQSTTVVIPSPSPAPLPAPSPGGGGTVVPVNPSSSGDTGDQSEGGAAGSGGDQSNTPASSDGGDTDTGD
jgi:hypothetical protein